MHRLFALFVLLLGISIGTPARAALQVVTSTADLASLVKEVGGKNVEVTSMALHSQDPHFVDAKPHLALKLAKADLLIALGLDLEIGWLGTLQTGSRNAKIQPGAPGFLSCAQFVKVLEVPTGPVDRTQGDVHPLGNPHYMFDPRQVARVTKGITDKLSELDPDHAKQYRENALAFIKKLGKATKGWEKKLEKIKGAKIISYHRSFAYFANWLGLDIVEQVEPRPGIPPNPHHVTHVIEQGKKLGVKMVMQEAYYPGKTSGEIAEAIGATLIRVPGAPNFRGGQSYIQHMDALVSKVAKVYGQ